MTNSTSNRDNTGALFKNNRKENDTHPDMTGQGTFNGEEIWISGWLKKDRNGKPFYSLSFRPKDQQRSQGNYSRDNGRDNDRGRGRDDYDRGRDDRRHDDRRSSYPDDDFIV